MSQEEEEFSPIIKQMTKSTRSKACVLYQGPPHSTSSESNKLENNHLKRVFDRLQVSGLCLSYQRTLKVLGIFGGSFNHDVIEAVANKKTIRLIGDNVNFKTKYHEQHFSDNGKKGEMHHAFGSAFLINDFVGFQNLQDIRPQRQWQDMAVVDFLLNKEDISHMKKCYIQMICKVVAKFIPGLNFVGEVVPQMNRGEHSHLLKEKTVVIPLETLPKNEQKYDEVVDVLDYYETILHDVHQKAHVELQDVKTFHIGGDQLTRERFSGAKRLRAGADNVKDGYGHLHPITFEMFHLLMNFLNVFNYYLYNENSIMEVGTMFSELKRIKRTKFEHDAKDDYDADTDFIVSFVDSYIVEMVLEYFGLESLYATPTKHIPPDFLDENEKKRWVYLTFGSLIDEYILKPRTHTDATGNGGEVIDEESTIFTCKLSNGKMVEINIPQKPRKPHLEGKSEETDGIFNYASRVLDLGLIYKELLEVCKIPDRKRLIRLMKQCMVAFKSKSNNSHYAVEVMRFLMQQLCLLSEKSATYTLYGMFVNTKGKIDSHIPADLQMEYLVKLIKKHIKHMFSNKTTANISKKTRALSSISSICERYDMVSHVKVRAKSHSHPEYYDDELMMIEDLRSVRPFNTCSGRFHQTFQNIKSSVEEYLLIPHFHQWIFNRIRLDGTDIAM